MAERRPGLDGLRGIAVLLVIACHTGFLALAGWGMVGVNIFFTLSGFLITGILLRQADRGGVSLRSFWERRARRILPALLGLVTVMLFLQMVVPSFQRVPLAPPAGYIGAVTFTSNWLWQSHDLGLLAHLWSLAVEEQFYLLWPFAFVALFQLRRRAAVRWAAVGIFLASLFSLWAFYPYDWAPFSLSPDAWGLGRSPTAAITAEQLRVYAGTDTRIYSLALGIVLATLPALWSKTVGLLGLMALGLLLLIPAPIHQSWELLVAGPVSVICATLLIGAREDVGLLKNRFLQYCGRRSYGLYVWSSVLASFALPGTSWQALLSVMLLTLTGFVVAEVSWRFLEKPFLEGRSFARRHARV